MNIESYQERQYRKMQAREFWREFIIGFILGALVLGTMCVALVVL